MMVIGINPSREDSYSILHIDSLQNEIIDMGALDTLLDFLENTEIEINDKEEKEKLEEIRKTMSKI
jgi:hypothetical protein